MHTRPAASARAAISSISATVTLTGFSTSTCLPAASAFKVSSWWLSRLVSTCTASMAGSASSSSTLS